MGIGISIVLLVIGLILLLGAIEEFPDAVQDVVDVTTVGWICLVVGIVGLVIAVAAGRRGHPTDL
jgi:hypothetical protein